MSAPLRQPASCSRREFLGNSARNAAGVAAGMLSLGMARSPNDALHVGVIGLGVRGRELARDLSSLPQVRISAVCDVDPRSLAAVVAELSETPGGAPAAVAEHERLLERRDLDAVVIATPDHWHRPLAEEFLKAGKDLYLEQPVGLTLADGAAVQSAAREAGRIVQTGLPQRSGAHFQSAVRALRGGEIGRVLLAKAWAVHRRRQLPAAGATLPPGVDYSRWLGPAAPQEFSLARFHQSWPWHWDYGSGELGWWGVQLLDVVRWGLDLDLPTRIVATGGNRSFTDGRQTPDTLCVQFEFPELSVHWEHRQWSSHGIEGRTAAAAFYGERGTLIIDRSGWKVYDGREGLFADASEIRVSHLRNWVDCLRSRQTPAADIEIGQRSMALCHLGNAAYRLGRELRFDPATSHCPDDPAANLLLGHTPDSRTPITEG